MAISFAKNCKDRCSVFSPCFGVIPGHTWGKNGTRPVITPTYCNFSGVKVKHWKTLWDAYQWHTYPWCILLSICWCLWQMRAKCHCMNTLRNSVLVIQLSLVNSNIKNIFPTFKLTKATSKKTVGDK